ncbi:hypothetical protein OF83DRAFT_1264941 [Amylostereum chailletii]|nr:hypothetical protein OF83DRAFT_1264941 [Amylostereum chailletii]
MKLNNPLPQSLPKECDKAARIFKSFVDHGNNGLDGVHLISIFCYILSHRTIQVIPRNVLENARGFAIFTLFKAGFLFSARAGSGVVIARLDDGTWSAPSAIGLAGVGVGGQAGAEMTDFLIVLNSRSAVRSFMAAGSLTLGGNMSLAVGPLGRNGEASGSLNTSGKVAAMYSYSKTRGLFGGVSIEGSVIVERQDANAQAYRADVAVKQILSGSIQQPDWAQPLIRTLDSCTGLPGGRTWVENEPGLGTPVDRSYAFNGISSPGTSTPPSLKKSKKNGSMFPPLSWGSKKPAGSYFGSEDRVDDHDRMSPRPSWDYDAPQRVSEPQPDPAPGFATRFESDFAPEKTTHPALKYNARPMSAHGTGDGGAGQRSGSYGNFRDSTLQSAHARSFSAAAGRQSSYGSSGGYDNYDNPFAPTIEDDDPFAVDDNHGTVARAKAASRGELSRPLMPSQGVARAIALFDFNAVQPGDLSFKKGQVLVITEKSNNVDTWWKGKVDGREGIFPANFVEVV